MLSTQSLRLRSGAKADLMFKRGFDILVSATGIIILSPFLIFVAVLVKLTSQGPIFHRATRIGRYGEAFKLYKYRSMVINAEKMGPAVTGANDPRITPVGSFLRRTKMDELPQLFNVFLGDMSLVGPRPERPEHVIRLEEKIPFYRTRHVVRPGVTGWAQVRYQYGSTDEDAMVKLQYDLYYIRHQSLALDVNIIIRTVGKVLRMAGV